MLMVTRDTEMKDIDDDETIVGDDTEEDSLADMPGQEDSPNDL